MVTSSRLDLLLGMAIGIVIASRLATVVPTAWLLRQGLMTGTVTALNLAQVSEFSLVILGLGVGYGHVTPGLQGMVLAAMLLASVLSTYIIVFNDRIARLFVRIARALGSRERGRETSESLHHGPPRDIVLLGCFREGLALLEKVEAELPALKQRILIIDFNVALKARLEGAGFAWAYGDLAHPETLVHLGLEQAHVIFSSISDTFLKGTSNRRLLMHARQIAPKAHLVFTADDRKSEEDLRALGAQEVILPAQVVADRLVQILQPLVERRRPTPVAAPDSSAG